MDASQLFVIFVLAGLLLMGAEIFVPGGVLGVIGGGLLIAAVLTGFVAFGQRTGMLAALAILIFLGVSIVLWMQLLPRTRLGRKLTLSTDTAGYSSAAPGLKGLVGKQGVAVSSLGPSGVIRIDGRRLDAVADGQWIEAGSAIRVVQVTGNHVTVRALPADPGTAAS